jgi:AraC family transcriptional regulator
MAVAAGVESARHNSGCDVGSGSQSFPVLDRTGTFRRPLGPVAYDCVKVMVVRAGSAILFSEFGQEPVVQGDVIVLGANTLCGSEPEGYITVTTVYLDTDYVIDQVFWQYSGLLPDRFAARDFAEAIARNRLRTLFVVSGVWLRLKKIGARAPRR